VIIKRGQALLQKLMWRPIAILFFAVLCPFTSYGEEPKVIATGSGFVIGKAGEIVTNNHVVRDCSDIRVTNSDRNSQVARVLAHDQINDLALLRTSTAIAAAGVIRGGKSIRPGDMAVALGYPLTSILASRANVAVGSVSALAGILDDARYLQITTPVQPGNSGGPLLDASGNVVGVVTAKLDAIRVAGITGDIPQNVNFAIKAEVLRIFLGANKIDYETAESKDTLSPADVGERGALFTVFVECLGPAKRPLTTAAKPPKPNDVSPKPPKAPIPTAQRTGLPALPKSGTIYRYDFSSQTNADTRKSTTQTITIESQTGPKFTALIEDGNGNRIMGAYQRSTLFPIEEQFLAGPQSKIFLRIHHINKFDPDSIFPLHPGQHALLKTEIQRTLRNGLTVSGAWMRDCIVSGKSRMSLPAGVFDALEVRCTGQLRTQPENGSDKTYSYESIIHYAQDQNLVLQSTSNFTELSTGSVETIEVRLFSINTAP